LWNLCFYFLLHTWQKYSTISYKLLTWLKPITYLTEAKPSIKNVITKKEKKYLVEPSWLNNQPGGTPDSMSADLDGPGPTLVDANTDIVYLVMGCKLNTV
jgi:hypothetical protein